MPRRRRARVARVSASDGRADSSVRVGVLHRAADARRRAIRKPAGATERGLVVGRRAAVARRRGVRERAVCIHGGPRGRDGACGWGAEPADAAHGREHVRGRL